MRRLGVVAALALPIAAQEVPPGPELDRLHAISARVHLDRAAHAEQACDWSAAESAAELAGRLAPRGSDTWYAACAVRARGLRQLWMPDELEALARDVLDELAERRRSEPAARRSAVGPLPPFSAGAALEIQLLLAEVLQSRGMRHEAVGHLRSLLADLDRGRAHRDETIGLRARLDLGRSLLRLGRFDEARTALDELVERGRGTAEAAYALVLLESGTKGLGAYRGKYEGDAAQLARMESLLAAVPRARARLARLLDVSDAEMPEVVVGIADAPALGAAVAALTHANPRIPDEPPMIAFFSEALAQDLADPETILVHELAHAVLAVRGGLAYDHLPAWIAEGASQALAGELDLTASEFLLSWIAKDPSSFLGQASVAPYSLGLERGDCGRFPAPATPLGIAYLDERGGPGTAIAFARGLARGGRPGAICEELVGLELSRFADEAGAYVARALDARRAELRPYVARLEEGRRKDPDEAARAAEDVLAGAPPVCARARALVQRAKALELLGRSAEAAEVYADLHAMRRESPFHAEAALLGRARCLIAAGRPGDARELLLALQRDAYDPSSVHQAAELLARTVPQEAAR